VTKKYLAERADGNVEIREQLTLSEVIKQVNWDGDRWNISGVGVTNDQDCVYCHLVSTTRFQQQRNGRCPVQRVDWIPSALLRPAPLAPNTEMADWMLRQAFTNYWDGFYPEAHRALTEYHARRQSGEKEPHDGDARANRLGGMLQEKRAVRREEPSGLEGQLGTGSSRKNIDCGGRGNWPGADTVCAASDVTQPVGSVPETSRGDAAEITPAESPVADGGVEYEVIEREQGELNINEP
jgi:hypothetical protein